MSSDCVNTEPGIVSPLPIGQVFNGTMPCLVDRGAALRFLGYAGQKVDAELDARFENLAHRCEEAHVGRYVWMVDSVDYACSLDGEACLRLKRSGLALPGNDIRKHLDGCKGVVLMAVTLGHSCERELARLKSTNQLDYLMYDACCSALAEGAAEQVHGLVSQWAQSEGFFAHARFSPGYGDLPLEIQPDFLQAVSGATLLGLSTNADYFLVPTKSVTAVIGLFDDEETGEASPCDRCRAFAYCNFREKGLTCHGGRL